MTKNSFVAEVNFKETKKRVLTRPIEQQGDGMIGKWEGSGVTELSNDCHGLLNWLQPKTLAKFRNIQECKIRESLEINNLETKAEYNKPIKVLNRDRGSIATRFHGSPCFVRLT